MPIRRPTLIALAIAGLLVAAAAPTLARVPASPATFAPAPNDAFADAIAISPASLPYQWQGNTDNAGVETGEPTDYPCRAESATVWFTLKMATTTFVRADTIGSDGSGLGVFRGAAPDSLTTVDCGNVANPNSDDERVVWLAKAGVTYRIRVTGRNPGATLNVRKVPRPANDDFAKARAITSFPTSLTTDLMNASREFGEPQPECATQGGNSIWYRISLPATRTIQVDASDTALDTYLLVTTGSKVNGLSVLNCQDDTAQVSNGSRITFTALAGKTYHLLLAGYTGEGGKVRVAFRSVTPPANDAFANARTLPQDGTTVKGDTTFATTQAGEPLTGDNCVSQYVGSTVWYTFVADASADYTMDTYGSWASTTIGIYTGASLGTLTTLQCTNTRDLTFSATAGTRYYVQVGGYDAENGPVVVHLDH